MRRHRCVVTLDKPWNDENCRMMFYFAKLWGSVHSPGTVVSHERNSANDVRGIWVWGPVNQLQIRAADDNSSITVELSFFSTSHKTEGLRQRFLKSLRLIKTPDVIARVNEEIMEDLEVLHRDWEESTLTSFCLLAARLGHPITDVTMREIHARFGRGGKYEHWIHDTPSHIRGMRIRPHQIIAMIDDVRAAVKAQYK